MPLVDLFGVYLPYNKMVILITRVLPYDECQDGETDVVDVHRDEMACACER